ncbi:uncharacterized protein LOC117106832 [Anneissia japonica]|uniref:uncharacterized protein LOC117106832 n=1 Tax=Anneissia japonica TaxID=1529436 RepID=UPI0014255C32|nr:uncharacterized protein LOC117106832 [Anneissia japonica]
MYVSIRKKMGSTLSFFVLMTVPLFCNGQQLNFSTIATITTMEPDRNEIIAWLEDLSTDTLVVVVAAAVVLVLLLIVCVLFCICYSCCKRRYTYSPQRGSIPTPVEFNAESKKVRYGFAASAARTSISELSPTSQKCAPWSDTTSHQLNKVNNKVTRKMGNTSFVVENEGETRPDSHSTQNGYRPRTSSTSTSIHSRQEFSLLKNKRKKSLIRENSNYPGGPSSNDNVLYIMAYQSNLKVYHSSFNGSRPDFQSPVCRMPDFRDHFAESQFAESQFAEPSVPKVN